MSSESGETLFKQAFLLTGSLQKQRPTVPVHFEMEKNRQWGMAAVPERPCGYAPVTTSSARLRLTQDIDLWPLS